MGTNFLTTPKFAPPARAKAVVAPAPQPISSVTLSNPLEAQAQQAHNATLHTADAARLAKERAVAMKAASSSKATFAGFDVKSLGDWFGTNPIQTEALITAANGGGVTDAQREALGSIGGRLTGKTENDIPWLLQHAAEHPAGSHYHGDFHFDPARIATAFLTAGTSEIGRLGANTIAHNVGGSIGEFAKGVRTLSEDPIHGVVKGVGRASGLGGGSLPTGAAPPPAPSQLAVKNALDKADLERRKSLATGSAITSVLGLAGDTNTKRTVLG